VIPGVPRSACRPAWSGKTAAVLGALLYFDGALADEPASARSHRNDPADNSATNAVIVTRHRITTSQGSEAGPKPSRRFPLDTPALLFTVQDLFNCLKHGQASKKSTPSKSFCRSTYYVAGTYILVSMKKTTHVPPRVPQAARERIRAPIANVSREMIGPQSDIVCGGSEEVEPNARIRRRRSWPGSRLRPRPSCQERWFSGLVLNRVLVFARSIGGPDSRCRRRDGCYRRVVLATDG
jgi:hypothetical protein